MDFESSLHMLKFLRLTAPRKGSLRLEPLRGVLWPSFTQCGGHVMRKETHIKSCTAAELKTRRTASGTDLKKVDAMTDAKLEKVIAEDEDERGLEPDWTQAKLVLPEPKQSVHLRLEQETIDFFRAQGKGHISRMQAVLKAYVTAHRSR